MFKKSLVKLACKQNKLKGYTCLSIKYVHESLVNINEKNILLYHLFFNRTTNEKTKITLFYVNFAVVWTPPPFLKGGVGDLKN